MNSRVPFSGVVVTYNEAALLPDCLESLSFCDEIVVVDLGSEDDCVSIAQSFGARALHHDRVPIVERVRAFGLRAVQNDWVIFLDPDEVFPKNSISEIVNLIQTCPKLGIISLPWRFYFCGKRLDYTRWGGQKRKPTFVHRDRVLISGDVHRGIKLEDGYEERFLTLDGRAVEHYWVDSYRELFEKHWRYIEGEGKARYNAGQRFTLHRLFRYTASGLKQSLLDCQGWRGGITGIFLSFFWAWYVFMSWLSLRKYQRLQN